MYDIVLQERTSPIKVGETQCHLPTEGIGGKVFKGGTRHLTIRQPITPETASYLRKARDMREEVSFALNEFHLRYSVQDSHIRQELSGDLLIGYKYGGAGAYRVVPGFSMKS